MFKSISYFVLIFSFIILFYVSYAKRKQNISIDPEVCGKSWERLISFIVDLVACYFVLYILTVMLKKVTIVNVTEETLDIIFPPLLWLYFSLFESSKMQATIGKAFEGLIVTDLNGNRISFLRASLRVFSSILSYITFFIGHIMIAFTKYHQGLHDKISNTLVIKKRRMRNSD